MPTPALTFILCSRNDQYQGDSLWRLNTSLDYLAEQVVALGRERDVEVIVADWGSDVPLERVVRLAPSAARLVSFLWVPPDVARPLQRDSPFPEVLALNAAARRSRGEYIGRIDQDTLVGSRFLQTFFELYEGRHPLSARLPGSLWYANRRNIPYRFAARCPLPEHVARFVRTFGKALPVWRVGGRPFWTYWVGIWLAHRDIWGEARGFDERLVYYNWMEVEMIHRLSQRHEVVNLGALTGCDFYHLEHAKPGMVPGTRHARKNADLDWRGAPPPVAANDEGWGLAGHELALHTGAERYAMRPNAAASSFVVLAAGTWRETAGDWLGARARSRVRVCRGWFEKAREAVAGRPLSAWPKALVARWHHRGGRP